MEKLNTRISKDVTVARIEFLLQEGFKKIEISNMAGVPVVTINKLMQNRGPKVTLKTHNKIKALHSDYIIRKSDMQDSILELEEITLEDKKAAAWMWLSLAITAMAVIGVVFVIRYILTLF
jgi:hypothetical protein